MVTCAAQGDLVSHGRCFMLGQNELDAGVSACAHHVGRGSAAGDPEHFVNPCFAERRDDFFDNCAHTVPAFL